MRVIVFARENPSKKQNRLLGPRRQEEDIVAKEGAAHMGPYPGGCTAHISGTGTCHPEGYLFSRYWYKERYQLSQLWYKEQYLFSRFLDEIYKVGYTFSKNWYKVGYTFQKIGIRNGYVFDSSMAGPRPKSGQVHPPGPILENMYVTPEISGMEKR